jgi:hypothetical protein
MTEINSTEILADHRKRDRESKIKYCQNIGKKCEGCKNDWCENYQKEQKK